MVRNDRSIWILASLIKLACPWYLGTLLHQVLLQPLLISIFLLAIVTLALLPVFDHNTLHRASLPRSLFWPEPLREFKMNFPIPDELSHHVAFWKSVFGHYTHRQIVLHDNTYPQVVYEIVDLDSAPGIGPSLKKYKRLLLSIHQKEQSKRLHTLTADEKRVYDLFAGITEKEKFRKAAQNRMRAQPGHRESFIKAIRRSEVYQEKFEEIFRQYDLPIELTRIPFVESFFNPKARSYVGAAGLWQFMPATARQYGLRVTQKIDERYDPFKSADSAAQLLKAYYKMFQSWPLAITAYNHGPGGLQKAIKQLQTTNFGEIATSYKGSNFGFYSRNYYAQFLAATYIMIEPERYFGKFERLPSPHPDSVALHGDKSAIPNEGAVHQIIHRQISTERPLYRVTLTAYPSRPGTES